MLELMTKQQVRGMEGMGYAVSYCLSRWPLPSPPCPTPVISYKLVLPFIRRCRPVTSSSSLPVIGLSSPLPPPVSSGQGDPPGLPPGPRGGPEAPRRRHRVPRAAKQGQEGRRTVQRSRDPSLPRGAPPQPRKGAHGTRRPRRRPSVCPPFIHCRPVAFLHGNAHRAFVQLSHCRRRVLSRWS